MDTRQVLQPVESNEGDPDGPSPTPPQVPLVPPGASLSASVVDPNTLIQDFGLMWIRIYGYVVNFGKKIKKI